MKIFPGRVIGLFSVIGGVSFLIFWLQDRTLHYYVLMGAILCSALISVGIIRYLEEKNMVTGEFLRGKGMMIASLIIIISAIARACGELAK